MSTVCPANDLSENQSKLINQCWTEERRRPRRHWWSNETSRKHDIQHHFACEPSSLNGDSERPLAVLASNESLPMQPTSSSSKNSSNCGSANRHSAGRDTRDECLNSLSENDLKNLYVSRNRNGVWYNDTIEISLNDVQLVEPATNFDKLAGINQGGLPAVGDHHSSL